MFSLDSEVKLAQRLQLNSGRKNNQGNTNSVQRSFICSTAENQTLKLVWINKYAKYNQFHFVLRILSNSVYSDRDQRIQKNIQVLF